MIHAIGRKVGWNSLYVLITWSNVILEKQSMGSRYLDACCQRCDELMVFGEETHQGRVSQKRPVCKADRS